MSHYLTSKLEHVDIRAFSLMPIGGGSLAAAATTLSLPYEVAYRRSCTAKLVVTSVTASDTCDVTIESTDDGTNWYTVCTFTQATGASTQRKSFVAGRQIRSKTVVADAGGGGVAVVIASLDVEAV